jgi:hypothetical protein
MKKWEYCFVRIHVNGPKPEEVTEMRKLGEAGWELVNVAPENGGSMGLASLKRQKP